MPGDPAGTHRGNRDAPAERCARARVMLQQEKQQRNNGSPQSTHLSPQPLCQLAVLERALPCNKLGDEGRVCERVAGGGGDCPAGRGAHTFSRYGCSVSWHHRAQGNMASPHLSRTSSALRAEGKMEGVVSAAIESNRCEDNSPAIAHRLDAKRAGSLDGDAGHRPDRKDGAPQQRAVGCGG